jgi:hypothetical protein
MKKTILLLALFSLIVGLTSCQKAEEVTVSKYFQAMKHEDKDTMSAMAIEPKEFKFKSFKIEKVEPVVVKPLELPAFEKQHTDLEAQKSEQAKVALSKKDACDELKDTLGSNPKGENAKKLADAEAAANEAKDKFMAINREIRVIKKKIDFEKSIITASLGVDKDFELFSGDTHLYKILVKVTMANDEVKDYVFLLRKNTLKREGESRTLNGRLVIVKIGTPEEIAAADKAVDEQEAATEPK